MQCPFTPQNSPKRQCQCRHIANTGGDPGKVHLAANGKGGLKSHRKPRPWPCGQRTHSIDKVAFPVLFFVFFCPLASFHQPLCPFSLFNFRHSVSFQGMAAWLSDGRIFRWICRHRVRANGHLIFKSGFGCSCCSKFAPERRTAGLDR